MALAPAGDAAASARAAADALRRLHPRAFFGRLLEQGVRSDGRGPRLARPQAAERTVVGGADAAASARAGGGRALAAVRALVGPPLPQQSRGWLKMAGAQFAGVCVPLRGILERAVGKRGLKELVLENGAACVVLAVDVCVIAQDGAGSGWDAALLASTEALRFLEVPELKKNVDDDPESRFEIVGNGDGFKLEFAFEPVPLSCGFFRKENNENSADDEFELIVDPTAEEVDLLDGGVVFAVLDKKQDTVLHMSKVSGEAVPLSLLLSSLDS